MATLVDMTTLRQTLQALHACPRAIEWLGDRNDPQAAWDECPRGDWLLWYAARRGVDHKVLVLAACACARTALVHVTKGEDRPRLAIETAEAWARGDATIDQVRAASAASYAASAAAYSASAAAYSASAAANAARAAADAADAACAAYSAASAYAAARAKAHNDMANIVRGFIPSVP